MAAGSRIPIAVDGGIRRGSDIFKAIALGASHVFVGRIPIWGLAVSLIKDRRWRFDQRLMQFRSTTDKKVSN